MSFTRPSRDWMQLSDPKNEPRQANLDGIKSKIKIAQDLNFDGLPLIVSGFKFDPSLPG